MCLEWLSTLYTASHLIFSTLIIQDHAAGRGRVKIRTNVCLIPNNMPFSIALHCKDLNYYTAWYSDLGHDGSLHVNYILSLTSIKRKTNCLDGNAWPQTEYLNLGATWPKVIQISKFPGRLRFKISFSSTPINIISLIRPCVSIFELEIVVTVPTLRPVTTENAFMLLYVSSP